MDTLYISNKQVHYLFADIGITTHADIYNLIQMTYSPNALMAPIRENFGALGVSEHIPTITDKFTLVLDFLGNTKTAGLEDVGNHFKEYLEMAGLPLHEDKDRFKISVPGLSLENIAGIVSNERFQEANRKINASPSNAWKVFIENEPAEK